MSSRTVLVVALAPVFGTSAAVGVNMLRKPEGGGRNSVALVAAKTDVPIGTSLTAEHLKTVEYPLDLVPSGAITKMEDALERGAIQPLSKDEVLLDKKLAQKGAQILTTKIPAGLRAFTIQTPHVSSAIAGFITPGNRVDVLLTVNDSGLRESGGGLTMTLLQNVEILAVDKFLENPKEPKSGNQFQSVTLLVTPEQVNELDLGQNRGILHLSLRGASDTTVYNVQSATIRGLEGRFDMARTPQPVKPVEAAPPAAAPPPPPLEIRTLRGLNNGMVQLEALDPRQAKR